MLGLRTRPAAADRPIGRFFAAAEGRRAGALGVAVGVVLLGLLAGCNSNPEPEALPSESPSATSQSPSPSASPTPTPPTMPAAAKGTSEASAKAFVRYWIETLNYAGVTGETAELRRISGANCAACNGIIDQIATVYGAGGHFAGDGWSLIGAKYQPLQPAAKPVLTARIDIAPQELVERAGAEPARFDGGRRVRIFRLHHRGESWTVSSIEAQQ